MYYYINYSRILKMNTINATEKQLKILAFIEEFKAKRGYPPTVSEVRTNFGISQKGAYDHLIALRKRGYIDWVDGASRTITIIKRGA
jgi:repressor LexA